MPSEAGLLIQPMSGVTVVNFQSPDILDTLHVENLAETMYDLAKQSPGKLLVDFSGVMAISSKAIGMLLELNKKLKSRQGELALCGIRREVLHILKITRVDSLFTIYPTGKAALAAWGIADERQYFEPRGPGEKNAEKATGDGVAS